MVVLFGDFLSSFLATFCRPFNVDFIDVFCVTFNDVLAPLIGVQYTIYNNTSFDVARDRSI